MDITVSFKKSWGKEYFYPVSPDAMFLADLIGKPTLLKRQLKLCKEIGWSVSIVQDPIKLEDILHE